jgi:hypothetical protein
MGTEPSKKVNRQLLLLVCTTIMAACGVFVACQQPPAAAPQAKPRQPAINLDEYVNPPKVFPYDLKSAGKEMIGKTVWVRTGYNLPYYTYDPATRTAGLSHSSGMLPPLEKLVIKDVFLQRAPVAIAPGQVTIVQKQVLAAVHRERQAGMSAVSVGVNTGEDFKFTANDIFYFADPHELYKHWPAEVWAAIDKHEARQGMNELQAEMALGTKATYFAGDYGNRTIDYSGTGKPIRIKFEKNHAVSIIQR